MARNAQLVCSPGQLGEDKRPVVERLGLVVLQRRSIVGIDRLAGDGNREIIRLEHAAERCVDGGGGFGDLDIQKVDRVALAARRCRNKGRVVCQHLHIIAPSRADELLQFGENRRPVGNIHLRWGHEVLDHAPVDRIGVGGRDNIEIKVVGSAHRARTGEVDWNARLRSGVQNSGGPIGGQSHDLHVLPLINGLRRQTERCAGRAGDKNKRSYRVSVSGITVIDKRHPGAPHQNQCGNGHQGAQLCTAADGHLEGPRPGGRRGVRLRGSNRVVSDSLPGQIESGKGRAGVLHINGGGLQHGRTARDQLERGAPIETGAVDLERR